MGVCAGNDTVSNSAQLGEHPARMGEDSARPGEDPARPGEDSARPGEDPARPGEDPARMGEDSARPGEHPARIRWKSLSIAGRMSQQCGVLSHRLQTIEPVNEGKRATIKDRYTRLR